MFRSLIAYSLALLLTVPGCCTSRLDSTEAPTPLRNDPPKVLIIGDSISMAYHKTVVAELAGVADVIRIPQNGQWAGTGVKKIDAWLGDTPWDVIHFNWGLWDMYGWEFASQDRSPDAYEQRLDAIVKRLKQTGATLIWATTTPACPAPEVTMRRRFKTDVVISPALENQYLGAAAGVMNKHGVAVNDLHALIKPDLSTYAVAPNNVHFTQEGSRVLGKQVAEVIRSAIKAKAMTR